MNKVHVETRPTIVLSDPLGMKIGMSTIALRKISIAI